MLGVDNNNQQCRFLPFCHISVLAIAVLYADAVYYQTENSIGPITSFTSTCIFLVYLVAFGQTVTKYAGSYQ